VLEHLKLACGERTLIEGHNTIQVNTLTSHFTFLTETERSWNVQSQTKPSKRNSAVLTHSFLFL